MKGAFDFGSQVSAFPPIGDYAFLSDCETTALIAPSGNVERAWLALPRGRAASSRGPALAAWCTTAFPRKRRCRRQREVAAAARSACREAAASLPGARPRFRTVVIRRAARRHFCAVVGRSGLPAVFPQQRGSAARGGTHPQQHFRRWPRRSRAPGCPAACSGPGKRRTPAVRCRTPPRGCPGMASMGGSRRRSGYCCRSRATPRAGPWGSGSRSTGRR